MSPLAARLERETDAMLQALQQVVEAESPSSDRAALDTCAGVISRVGEGLLGVAAERLEVEGRAHLRWRRGAAARVGVLCHFDTVWPLGTLARRPFTVVDGLAYGPGVFDMKAGIVQGLFALGALGFPDGVEVLITSDEEVGSGTSRGLIEDLARRCEAVLVLEASHGGALKVGRKGVSTYAIEITGAPAHAGLEPEKGVNAVVELAHVVLALDALARHDAGTTVTPTVARAGIATNVVAPSAELDVDVRAFTIAEQERVDTALKALRPTLHGAAVRVKGGPNRPPLEEARARDLFERAGRLAEANGLRQLTGVAVGGGSDGNFTAALGTPTLDGLGAVGDGAHAEHEHVVVEQLAPRATLLALLVEDLLR